MDYYFENNTARQASYHNQLVDRFLTILLNIWKKNIFFKLFSKFSNFKNIKNMASKP